PVGSVEKPRDSSPPKRSRGSHGRETCLQDVQLVSHSVTALCWHPRPMELARRFRDLPGQPDTCRRRQEIGRRTAGDLALQPHLELRHRADRLGHRNPVLAIQSEPGVPQRTEEPVAGLAEPPHPHLADQRDHFQWGVGPLYFDVILDHATSSGFVSRHTDLSQVDDPVLAGQSWQTPPKLSLCFLRVERERKGRHCRVRSDAEWIDHRNVHRLAPTPTLTSSVHSSSKRSTCPVSVNRSSTRRRAATPIRAASSGFRSNCSSAAASACVSPTGTSRPVTPSSTSSGMPPTAVATAGTPQAAASMRLTGIPSLVLGS